MKKWTRWVPAIGIPALIITAGAVVVPMSATAAPDLPTKTPEQVLALVAASDVAALSGAVTVTSELGLPSLAGVPGPSGADIPEVLDLLTGSHDLRVYRDGTDARVQLIDGLEETDVVASADEVWVYSSDENSVLHLTGADAADHAPTTVTPDDLAAQLVAELEPTSTLSVDTAQSVAGRDAYTLVLEPEATETLVGSVAIAVDAANGVPLSVAVTPRGTDEAALSVAFTSIDYAKPSSDLFAFTPPAGAEVTEKAFGEKGGEHADEKGELPTPTVTGEGWASVISVAAGAEGADLSEVTSSPLFAQLAQRVDGGWLLHTSLVNVLLTDDGDVLAGSVPASVLEAAAR